MKSEIQKDKAELVDDAPIDGSPDDQPKTQKKMKQKSHSPELISRPLVTTASQENDAAKIQNKNITAKQNLLNVAKKYAYVNDPKGFITNLKNALGMNVDKASNYNCFVINEKQMRVSIRISNHHANAGKYLEHKPNDFNLSIMISKRYRKNTFLADPDVILEEYVYMGRQLETVESPFSQIALSLAKFLDTGEYVDTTGVAKVNFSPELPPDQHTDC